jgi:hypothetical protein
MTPFIVHRSSFIVPLLPRSSRRIPESFRLFGQKNKPDAIIFIRQRFFSVNSKPEAYEEIFYQKYDQ